MSSSPSRQAWPDYAKGAGILLMALGHSLIPPLWVAAWIYTFHMPLFFFLSGWFFSLREGSPLKTMAHKAFPILMPMVSYSLAYWLWQAAAALMAGNTPGFAPLLGILLQWPDTPYAGLVWFFPGLFVGEFLFALLLKYLGSRPRLTLAASFLLAGLVWLAVRLGLPRLPWHAGAAALLVPYLALGWYARRQEAALDPLARRYFLPLVPALAALSAGLTALNLRLGPTRIDYNLRCLNEYFTCYLAGAAGIALCVLISRCLPRLRLLAFLGEYSAVYYTVGWVGSNIAGSLLSALVPLQGLPLLLVHMAGLVFLPIPLILLLDRFCPALMGKRRPSAS